MKKNKNKKNKKKLKKAKKVKRLFRGKKKAKKPQKRTIRGKKKAKAKKLNKKKKKSSKSKVIKNAFLDVGKIRKDFKKLELGERLGIIFSEVKDILSEQFDKAFSLGAMTSHQAKISVLLVAILFTGTVAVFERYEYYKLVADLPKGDVIDIEELKRKNFEVKLREVVKGHPIEKMVPYIAEKDRKTAAFLIGIAKKESNWGKRKPVLAGKDCYNYWGFRQEREKMGSGGHTCFDSPKDAVDTVAKRVSQIIERNEATSAKKMIVWKCGYSCATHSAESVRSWIRDVDYYAGKILN